MAIQEFIRKTGDKVLSAQICTNSDNGYRPLLACWLLELALALGWYKVKKNRNRDVFSELFENDDFSDLTDISLDFDKNNTRSTRNGDSGKDESKKPTSMLIKSMLQKRLKTLRKEKMSYDAPLFRNIALLADVIGLTEADQAILVFASALDLFQSFREAIASQRVRVSHQVLCQLLSQLTEISEHDFRASLADTSLLATTGLIKYRGGNRDLEDRFNMMEGFSSLLLVNHQNSDELVKKFFKKAQRSSLKLLNFPHLKTDTDLLHPYLTTIIKEKTIGVNILIYGKPGVGKSEYIQSLAEDIGVDLYEVAFADENGDPIKGEARLRAYNLCQCLLAKTPNALLLFDEVEDVFPSDSSKFLKMIFGGSGSRSSSGKAWINRTMEQNNVPAIWISNQIEQIDPAYLRRFDYSIQFSIPPKSVRFSIAEHHLSCFEPSEAFLERLADNSEITPAQFEKGSKIGRLASGGNNQRAIELVEQALDRSSSLLGQKKLSKTVSSYTGYSLEYLNTDIDISKIIDGLKKKQRGTFCFYGISGTGKSQLSRHIAEQLEKPCLLKRASDILDKYVGGTEKHIAEIFQQATRQDSVLVLDEADSFLADRRYAQRNWEVSQINELLTQMEAFNGIFICTTNLMENLDPASLRRFMFKVQFNPLTEQQRLKMFHNELVRLGGVTSHESDYDKYISKLELLTPGDFAVAARQFDLWDIPATAETLYEQLLKEYKVKGRTVVRKIGFGEI